MSRAGIKGYGWGTFSLLVLRGGHLNATKAKSIFYLPRSKKSKYTGMFQIFNRVSKIRGINQLVRRKLGFSLQIYTLANLNLTKLDFVEMSLYQRLFLLFLLLCGSFFIKIFSPNSPPPHTPPPSLVISPTICTGGGRKVQVNTKFYE